MGQRTDIDGWLEGSVPPASSTPALRALWWAQRGDWEQAHRLVQDESDTDAAWVHAWLHRVEGDAGNAAYWYRRAGRPDGSGPPSDEWRRIAAALRAAA